MSEQADAWEVVESSRAAAHRVLTFLADRRVLFNPYWQEQAGECVASVLEVRRMLTGEIGDLHADDGLGPHLDAMRAACRRFLDRIGEAARSDGRGLWVAYRELDHRQVPLVVGLGELRAAMGIQVGLIAAMFDLDVPDTLAEILPPPPDDGAELDIDLQVRDRRPVRNAAHGPPRLFASTDFMSASGLTTRRLPIFTDSSSPEFTSW